MSPSDSDAALGPPLPLDDPVLATDLDLRALAAHWAPLAARRPISAEQMRGADRRAQRLGTPGEQLMEQAGAAVAFATRALLRQTARGEIGPVVVLAGPGNNGGDGSVAARHLGVAGVRTVVVLLGPDAALGTSEAQRNWERLGNVPSVDRVRAASARDVSMLANGIERSSVIVDALLGTGVRGQLRDPVRAAVELANRVRSVGVPVLAVDCPTAVDLTTGEPSDPVLRADVTVTFHRPKTGLLTRLGKALAGHVLVAPIGIPAAADPT